MFSLLLLCGCGAGAASKFQSGTATTVTSATSPSTVASTPTATGGGSSSSTASSWSSGSGGSSTPTGGATPGPAPSPSPTPTASTVPGYDQLMALPFQAGITHTDGRYGFTGGNFLIEGAQKILDLGSPAIFLYMTPNFRTGYPDRGAGMWPASNPVSLTELAQTLPYQKVFNMPFQTIVITAYGMANGDDINKIYSDPSAAAAEEKEFYDFARYLYSTYAGTVETFVLKLWEGDFIALNGYHPELE